MEWLSAAMDILTIVLAAVILPAMAWQGIVTLFGLLPRRRRRPLEDRQYRFAVVICARNEEAVIGHLIESLKAQRYPKESYRVFVIADNCTDNTAGAAEKGGATVFERFNPEKRGKGYAMRWGLQKIQELYPDAFDAVCVFDADNLAEENFLAEMNKALCSGAEVATGYLEPKNPQDSWTSGCYALYWLMMMRFYHEARNNCGLSSTITGTGFAFKLSALGEDGWNTATITEDCEFTIQQVCAGHHIAAVREAVFYDEQPVTQAVSMRQRFRWLVGTIQCGKQCLPAVWRSVRRGNWRALDMAVHVLSVPAMALMVPMTLASLLAMALNPVTMPFALPYMIVSGVLNWLAISGAGLLVTLLEKRPVRPLLPAVLLLPLFMIPMSYISLAALLHPKAEWKPIAHSRSKSVTDMAGLR